MQIYKKFLAAIFIFVFLNGSASLKRYFISKQKILSLSSNEILDLNLTYADLIQKNFITKNSVNDFLGLQKKINFKDAFDSVVQKNPDQAVDVYELYCKIFRYNQYMLGFHPDPPTATPTDAKIKEDQKWLDFIYLKNKKISEEFARAVEVCLLQGYFLRSPAPFQLIYLMQNAYNIVDDKQYFIQIFSSLYPGESFITDTEHDYAWQLSKPFDPEDQNPWLALQGYPQRIVNYIENLKDQDSSDNFKIFVDCFKYYFLKYYFFFQDDDRQIARYYFDKYVSDDLSKKLAQEMSNNFKKDLPVNHKENEIIVININKNINVWSEEFLNFDSIERIHQLPKPAKIRNLLKNVKKKIKKQLKKGIYLIIGTGTGTFIVFLIYRFIKQKTPLLKSINKQ